MTNGRITVVLCVGLLATSGGCASALRPLPDDSPLANPPTERDEEGARVMLERAASAFERRPERAAVREAAQLAIRAALAAPDAVEPIVAATRAYVWLASHQVPGPAGRSAAQEAARTAVDTAQFCRLRAPDHEPCDYWLAIAVGVQADVQRSTALDGLDLMVELLRAAIVTVPDLDHAGPYRVLARVLVNAPGWPTGPGDPDEGLGLAREAVRRAPDWAPNQLALGEALREIDQDGRAREAYERGLELARRAHDAGQPDASEWIDEANAALAALR